ncbi:MAG: CatB-related O-acetyltransferase [Planctomycetes bacterium]|nr:CatB-related O-acetyltransferase [Planctomycetota bacterium]
MEEKHWSIVEYLHETVKNPNIHVKGSHSYYSPAWSGSFEQSVVRYHYGDEFSLAHWQPAWPIDQLHIGNYVCIGPEAVIIMGGNNTHRADWFSCYPHLDRINESYVGKGDTILGDGCWLGMRCMVMPGVRIGEGAIIAAGAVVTGDVEPYAIVGGNPAKIIKLRFEQSVVARLMALRIYDWPEEKFTQCKPLLCSGDIDALEKAAAGHG